MNIYSTLRFTVDTLHKVLPKYSNVLVSIDNDHFMYITASTGGSKYRIALQIMEYDTIVTYDCRVESKESNEHEFNHSTLTLSETINKAYNWILNKEKDINGTNSKRNQRTTRNLQ